MVIVIPLEVTEQLIQVAQACQLNLPVPLSSGCESYLSFEEMDIILTMLKPMQTTDSAVARLLSSLQDYQAKRKPVVPCES